MSVGSPSTRLFWMLAAAWIASVLWWATAHWPVVPLDMSASDAATLDALAAARRALRYKAGLATACGLAVLLAVIRLFSGRSD